MHQPCYPSAWKSTDISILAENGCRVTGFDLRPIKPQPNWPSDQFFSVQGDMSDEETMRDAMAQAQAHFPGPINILIANAGVSDEAHAWPIWKIPLEVWEKRYHVNIRGTFLTIKHFLAAAEAWQDEHAGTEVPNLAVVLTGSETGVYGQAGHAEYASGKAGLQYGLVRSVKNEIIRLNRRARINAVAPGWIDTPMNYGRLDDPHERWVEAEATVPMAKIGEPEDVGRTMAWLASHRAAGHVTGMCINVDGGMEGRIVWPEEMVRGQVPVTQHTHQAQMV